MEEFSRIGADVSRGRPASQIGDFPLLRAVFVFDCSFAANDLRSRKNITISRITISGRRKFSLSENEGILSARVSFAWIKRMRIMIVLW